MKAGTKYSVCFGFFLLFEIKTVQCTIKEKRKEPNIYSINLLWANISAALVQLRQKSGVQASLLYLLAHTYASSYIIIQPLHVHTYTKVDTHKHI